MNRTLSFALAILLYLSGTSISLQSCSTASQTYDYTIRVTYFNDRVDTLSIKSTAAQYYGDLELKDGGCVIDVYNHVKICQVRKLELISKTKTSQP